MIFICQPGVGDFQYFRITGADTAFSLFGPGFEAPIVYDHWVYLPLIVK